MVLSAWSCVPTFHSELSVKQHVKWAQSEVSSGINSGNYKHITLELEGTLELSHPLLCSFHGTWRKSSTPTPKDRGPRTCQGPQAQAPRDTGHVSHSRGYGHLQNPWVYYVSAFSTNLEAYNTGICTWFKCLLRSVTRLRPVTLGRHHAA